MVATLAASLGCGGGRAHPAGSGGAATGGSAASGGQPGGGIGGSGGSGAGGTTASSGGSGPAASGGRTGEAGSSAGTPSGGGGGAAAGPTTGGAAGGGGISGSAGTTTASGGAGPGGSGAGGTTGSGGHSSPASALVTSSSGLWASGTWTEAPTATPDMTVNDAVTAQTWEGFGGAFHEMGWNLLTTKALQDEAINLLFGADGARLTIARIPIGASDYALERYTLDDTGPDVTPDGTQSNRPPSDLSLSQFSIERDKQTLIPYVKAAQAVNPGLRFWAVPWTPPVWMKTGYKTDSAAGNGGPAVKPSYFDGGTMKSDDAILSAYAQYLVKFVQAYKGEGIDVEAIAPQDEPAFDQNYPSCVWDDATYTRFVGGFLGPALTSAGLATRLMAGTLADYQRDLDRLTMVMSDAAAKPFIKYIGVEWDLLDKVEQTPLTYTVPVWATEHKCGNYPFYPSGRPATSTTPAIGPYTEPPANDQSYAIETWWYIRDAIKRARVTAYNAVHLVLDAGGKGNDTSRDWAQDSLLTVSGGAITKTQAYYVFRHFSQFVAPGAVVVTTAGGDAVAFKNPDGSLVTVVFSSAGKADYVVAIGGKKLRFAIPAGGWATLKYTP